MFEIGDYQIYDDDEDATLLWIYDKELGHGGQFSKQKLIEVIEKFFFEEL